MMSKFSRREFLRRAAASTAGAVLASSSTAAFADAVGSTQGKPSLRPAQADKKTVTFTMYGHQNLAEEMVKVFNESHPDIEIKFERSEGQGYGEKVLAAIASGSAWDIFRSPNPADALRYGAKGIAEDIAPYLKADTTYPADLYLPGALDAFKVGDKQFGLPVWALTMWLYYNKKLLDEAGVAYPTEKTTWEEYVEMTKKLTKKNDAGAVTQYGANGWGSWTMPVAQDVWSAGGHFYYNDDLTAIKLDDPETIKTLQDEADLMNVLKVNPSPLTPPTSPVSLLSKNVATELNGDWMPWDNREQFTDEFDATLTPLRNGKRTNIYYVDTFILRADSQVKDAAYKWFSWWAADPASWAIQGKVVSPLTKRMYEDPKLAATWLQAPRPAGMIKLALEHSKQAKFWRVEGHASEFEGTVYYSEIDKLWRNAAPAKDVVVTIMQKGNDLLKQPIE
jgi:multiple sugar transport system substrate-binding protein